MSVAQEGKYQFLTVNTGVSFHVVVINDSIMLNGDTNLLI